MNKESKILAFLGLATVAVFIGGILFFTSEDQSQSETQPVSEEVLYNNSNNQTSDETKPVQIVEFGDFQCPACAQVKPIVDRVMIDRGDDVNLIFRHLPLISIHKNAMISSIAAEAAANQDKFWEMYDLLYQNQAEWSDSNNPEEIFANYAQELELDIDQFKSDLESDEVKARVQTDLNDVNKLGVNATPTFYVNGVKLARPSYQNLISAIDKELAN